MHLLAHYIEHHGRPAEPDISVPVRRKSRLFAVWLYRFGRLGGDRRVSIIWILIGEIDLFRIR
jgi:hypothetical protein